MYCWKNDWGWIVKSATEQGYLSTGSQKFCPDYNLVGIEGNKVIELAELYKTVGLWVALVELWVWNFPKCSEIHNEGNEIMQKMKVKR